MIVIAIVCALAAALVAIVCAAGCFLEVYEDNTAQRLGMAGVGLGAAVKAFDLASGSPVQAIDPFVWIGLALFALGTAVKVWHHRPRQPSSIPR